MTPKLTRDDAMILALASGLSWRAAAKQAGTSHSTIARRMATPEFRQKVIERRSALMDQAAGLLTGAMSRAVKTLRKLLASGDDQVKLGAARAILASAINVKSLVEFEQRLAALESEKS